MKKWMSLLLIFCTLPLYSQRANKNALEQLVAQYDAKITYNQSTGMPSFIRFGENTPMNIPVESLPKKAALFFETYEPVFGMQEMKSQFILVNTIEDLAGGMHLVFQQQFHGIPVFGGDLRLHFNRMDELTAISGVVIPNISISISPQISEAQAASIALESVSARFFEASVTWTVQKMTRYVFHKGLVQGVEGADYLVNEIIVTGSDLQREFVYVDMATGNILDQFPGTCNVLFRRLYEGDTNNQIWQEGDPFPGPLTSWQQSEMNATKDAYYFFKNAFGRDSYDNSGAEMKVIHNPTGFSCPEGMWSGLLVKICDQIGTDDVMGHEWGHAYTEFTNNLIYAWQSGALNESYSDIWGETIDLLSPDGNDNVPRTSCNSSQLRWKFTEDAAGFGGAIRDLWDPTCKGHPGKVTDTEYSCNSVVHTNSGVANHAYALLTDGGTYNGQTITGLGLTKAAHIFWQTEVAYLTNTSDFTFMADALEAACNDLIGINLEGLSITTTPAGPSGQIITAADCQEVVKVNNAVEFRTNPNTQPEPGCNYQPLLGQSPPALCSSGFQSNLFDEDFESGVSNWTISQIPTNPSQWTPRQWVIDSSPPNGHAGSVVHGPTPDPHNCEDGDEIGIIRMESPIISIPGNVTAPVKMSFEHSISLEPGYDGGNLKYSLNGGAWTLLPSSAFSYNAYIYSSLIPAASGNDCPLAGQPGFSAADPGYVTGTWGQSLINLNSIGVVPGSTFQFRFELGTNSCIGWDGWYLDNVQVFTCELVLPVELTDFRAIPTDDAVRLEWATALESENLAFELQRSSASFPVYDKIATLQGKGSVSSGSFYSFNDYGVQPGQTYYYRLRQIDFKGLESYSPVVAATLSSEAQLMLLPNPFQSYLEVYVSGGESQELEIVVFDLRGARMFSMKKKNGEWVDLSELDQGMYLIKVRTDTGMYTGKLVKER